MSDEQDQQDLNNEVVNDDEFNSGFDAAYVPTETPEQVEEDPAEEQEPPAPQYRQITEQEYEQLMNSATLVSDIKAAQEKQFGTAFGKIGGIERHLQQLQHQTPNGQSVELTDEDVAEMAEEFPELAGMTLKVLQNVVGKMRGTGPAIDETVISNVRKDAVRDAKVEISLETLDETHEGWRDIVGLPDGQGNLPDTEYRRWLGEQPENYRQRLEETNNHVVIGRSIDKFNEYKKQKQAKQDTSRRDRFADAVDAKGDGGHQSAPTGDDEFEAGFKGR